MKLSDYSNAKSDNLNVKFSSKVHENLNFEYSGSNALSSAWTKLLEVKNPIRNPRWEKALLDASIALLYPSLYLRSCPQIAPVLRVHLDIDDICFTIQNANTLRFPHINTNTLTQIHFAFELQEGVNHKKEDFIDFLKIIATKHFEANNHVTKLSIAITEKNNKNIVVAMDTIRTDIDLAFLIQSLNDSSHSYGAHPILQRVLSRMIIAYISKESVRYVEESTTDSVYKKVGFVCNEDGSIQGSTLGDSEEGYSDWDVIVPQQVVNPNYYQYKYDFNCQPVAPQPSDYQLNRKCMTPEEWAKTFEAAVQRPYIQPPMSYNQAPTFYDQPQASYNRAPVSVNQVVEYTTLLTREYFRQEMMTDINFYIKVSHFLTDIHNFATGKK